VFSETGGCLLDAHGGLWDGHCVFLLNKSLLGRGLCFWMPRAVFGMGRMFCKYPGSFLERGL